MVKIIHYLYQLLIRVNQIQRRNRKKMFALAMILILFVLPITLVLNNLRVKKAAAAWFDDNWAYRKSIAITNGSGSNLSNYQVVLTLDTSDTTKFQSNCNDVRITDINGNLLPYWIEENNPGCGSASTKIWTKVSSIPTSGATIYVYYGNASATSYQNGENTFEFFDDFSGSFLNSAKWQQYNGGTPTFASGTLTVNSTADPGKLIAISASQDNNYTLRARFKVTAGTSADERAGLSIKTSTSTGQSYNYVFRDFTALDETSFLDDGIAWNVRAGAWSKNTYYSMEIYHDGTNVKGRVNDGSWASQAWSSRTGYPALNFGSFSSSATTVWDFALVRKMVATEPTTSAGSEEKGTGPVAYWKFDEGYGNITTDSASQKIQGTISGATWKSEDLCLSGKCLNYDASAYQSVAISNNITNGWSASNDFSVSLWFNCKGEGYSSDPTYTYLAGLFIHGTSAESGSGGFYLRQTSTTCASVAFAVSTSASHNTLSANLSSGQNTWSLLTAVKSGDTLMVYENGLLKASQTFAGASWYVNVNQESRIGSVHERSIKGFIDEVKVYNYARSDTQIRLDYNSGLAGAGAGDGTGVSFGDKSDKWMSQNLIGYWKLDEAATPSIDSSGNGNSGTWVSSPTVSAGKFGNALTFNSSNNYVNIGDVSTLEGLNSITISAWVNLTSNKSYNTIFSKEQIYKLRVQSTGTIQFLTGENWGGSILTTSTTLSTGTWYHIVAVYDGSVKKIYINGVQDPNTISTSGSISSNSYRVYIGAWDYSDYYDVFNGKIDEVRLYSRSLNPQEAIDLYSWAPGPVGYWNFEEGQGSVAYDRSGNGNTGTWQGSNTHWITGKYGKGGQCTFDTDFISMGNSSTIVLNGQGQLSLGCWVKTSDSGDRQICGTISDDFIDGYGFFLRTDGKAGLILSTGTYTGGYTDLASTTSINDNKWHYLAGTYDGATIRLYVDGIQEDSVSATGTISSSLDFSVCEIVSLGSAIGYGLNGYVDNIFLYDYSRTPKQVVQDMNAGHPAPGSPVGSALGYWKFDEGYGTITSNSGTTGFSNYGTLTSSPSWNNQGKFNKSINFTGGSKVVVTENNAFDPAEITLSAWIKPDPVAQTGNFICKGDNSGYRIRVGSGGGTVFQVDFLDRGATNNISAPATFATNNWYHVAATGNSSGLKIYINGVLYASNSTAYGGPNTANDLIIGSTNGIGESFVGSIDEVKIYNFALTASEVKLEYNHGSSTVLGSFSDTSGLSGGSIASNSASATYCVPGSTDTCNLPVGEWKFEEAYGQTANDTSEKGNTGQLGSTGGSDTTDPSWTTGKIGKALSFDGSNDYVTLGNPDADLRFTGNGTIEAWVKLDSSYNSDGWVFSKQSDGSGYWEWGMALVVSSTRYVNLYVVHTDGGAHQHTLTSDNLLTTNKWYHLTGKWESPNLKIYIDGIETDTSDIGAGTLRTGTYRSSSIGASNVEGTPAYPFKGLIDHVSVFDYSRTASQVAWDYNQGKPVGYWKFNECGGMTAYDSAPASNYGAIIIGSSGTQASLGTCTTSAATAWYNGRTGKYNSSLNLDGTDDYIAVNKTYDDIQTVSLWVKPSSIASSALIDLDGGTHKITVSSGTISASGFSSPTIYVNGLVSTTLAADSWQHVTVTTGTSFDSSSSMTIGKSSTTYLSGQIDEVKIYNYQLTKQQVLNDYNQGSAVRFGPNTGTP